MSVVDNWNLRPSWAQSDNTFFNYFIIACFVVCFVGSLPSKIAALRYFTFITAIINLFLGVVLIAQIPKLRNYYENTAGAKYEDVILDKNIFGSYCLSLFSSVNQFSVVNVLSEYKNPTERRVNKVDLYLILAYLQVSIHSSHHLRFGIHRWIFYLWRQMPRNYHQ